MLEDLRENQKIKEEDEIYFEMASIWTELTDLPYEIWVYEDGKEKKTKDRMFKLRNENCNWLDLTYTDGIKVIAGDIKNFPDWEVIRKFIKDNPEVFYLQWNQKWDSMVLALYIIKVGKEKKSKQEAYAELKKEGYIKQIPDEEELREKRRQYDFAES